MPTNGLSRFPGWLGTVIALVVTAIFAGGFIADIQGEYEMPNELYIAFFAVMTAVFGVGIWKRNNDRKS